MSLVSVIKGVVRAPASHGAAFGDPFVELDRESTARELGLEERGRRNGALNLPPPQAETFDAVEMDIIATVGNALARAQNEAAAELANYAKRVIGLDKLRSVSTIDGAARAAVADMAAAASRHRRVLEPSRNRVDESATELAEFRRRHGLSRPAVDAAPAAAVWGPIIVTAAVELAFNAYFLRDDLGWIGGILSASVITLINSLLLGWLGGRFSWPYMQHRNPPRRILGWALTFAWIISVVSWNLLAAHYRLAKLASDPVPDRAALARFQAQPFSLGDMQTIAFLAIGMAAAIIAAVAFHRMDDPYPGYGAITRRHAERFANHEEEVEHATMELQSERDQATAQAISQRDALTTQMSAYGQIVNGYNRYVAQYRDHLVRLQRDANALLELYRNANRAARMEPVPPHFNRAHAFAPDAVVASIPLPLLPADLETQVAEAGRRLDAAIAAINDAFERETPTLDSERARAQT